MKVYKLELEEQANPLYVASFKEVGDALGCEEESMYDVGDIITISVMDMSEEDFNNLPEWDGP